MISIGKKVFYDIIRFVEHQQSCYMVSDNVEGMTLADYLKVNPRLTKRDIREMLNRVINELACFHRCQETGFYKFVNPYGIIMSGEGDLFLLDPGADSNRDVLAIMRKRAVREQFQPPDNSHYQSSSLQLDVYGFGKVVQYILASSEIIGGLTGIDEYRYRHIIKKCLAPSSQRKIKDISQISRCLPNNNEKIMGRALIACAGIFFLTSVVLLNKDQITVHEMKGHKIRISESLGDRGPDPEEFKKAREACKSLLNKERENVFVSLLEDERDILLKDRESAKSAFHVGELLLPGIMEEEDRYKATAFLADAAHRAGEGEKAEKYYHDLLQYEKNSGKREEIYRVISVIREEMGDFSGAGEICMRGMEEFPESEKLAVAHMSALCRSRDTDVEKKETIMRRYLETIPGLAGNTQFETMAEEYGVSVEGYQVKFREMSRQ